MTFATLLDDVGTMTPIVSVIVTVAVIYLRMFLKTALYELKGSIYGHLDAKYLDSTVVNLRLQAIERRLNKLEDMVTINNLSKLP